MNRHHRLILEQLEDGAPMHGLAIQTAIGPKLGWWARAWFDGTFRTSLRDMVSRGWVAIYGMSNPSDTRVYYRITKAGLIALDCADLSN